MKLCCAGAGYYFFFHALVFISVLLPLHLFHIELSYL